MSRLVVSVLAILTGFAAQAQLASVWTNLNGGSWTNASNWSNNIVPSGAGATADFSKLTLSSPVTVTLDSAPKVGDLIFGDLGNINSWEIDPGNGGRLTLSATNTPTITVQNQTASITSVLGTTKGLIKAGPGTLSVSAQDSLVGGVTVNGGTLLFDIGAVFDAGHASSLTINNGGTVEWSSAANTDGTINGPLPVTINAGGVLSVTERSAMGYNYAENYPNITVNGGTFDLSADQYINTITLNGGLVTGSGVIAYWYAIPKALTVTSNATIATGLALNNSFLANIDVAAGQTLTLGYFPSGGSVTLTGGGTVLVTNDTSSVYPYTGTTTIKNGTMLVGGLLGSGPVTNSGTFGGTGTVDTVAVNAGGRLLVSPDVSSNAVVGTLTVNTAVILNPGSTNFMRIAKTGGSATNDVILLAGSTIHYGGALVVANITSDKSSLAAGDTFALFSSANTYSGNFNTFDLPALPSGLGWNLTSLTTNGSISVFTGASTPTFSPPGGAYSGAQAVSISSLTPGATIYYTTNGSTPTLASEGGPSGVLVTVPNNAKSLTIQALVEAPGYSNSPVVSATYDTTLAPGNANTNPPAVLAISALGTPPYSQTSGTNPALVKVLFDQRVDTDTGSKLSTYSISGGATVAGVSIPAIDQAASLGGDWREVLVATAGLMPGQNYTLTINGIKRFDGTGNALQTNLDFKTPTLQSGSLEWDYYYLSYVVDLNALLSFPSLGTAPLTNAYLSSFDTTPLTGGDLNNNPAFGSLGDAYGDSVSGWLTPTVSGDYTFFLSSDDQSRLYLSTDASPINAKPIAEETGNDTGFQEPGSPTTSSPQTLQAGKSYFIQALHVEIAGSDFVKVAWRLSTDSTPAANLQPIAGQFFSSYAPALAAPSFSGVAYAGGQITLNWTGTATLEQSTDLKTWTPVPGNPTSPYTINPAAAPLEFYRLTQ